MVMGLSPRSITPVLASASMSFVGYQACSLFVLNQTSAVTHSLLNSLKRLVTVLLVMLIEGKTITVSAMFGLILALGGTAIFNQESGAHNK